MVTPVRPARAAESAAEAIRELNRGTIWGGYHRPSDVDEVIGELQCLSERLPQAIRQAAAWLQAEQARGRVGHDSTPSAVVAVVADLLADLVIAAERAESLACALRFARANSCRLTGAPQ